MKRLGLLSLILCCSSVWAYPPDNAAVLYQKAFFLIEFPTGVLKQELTRFAKGDGPYSEAIGEVLQKNQHVLSLTLEASKIKPCDWGLNDQEGMDMLMPELAPARQMSYLLLADARRNLAQGRREDALKECLAGYRMAYHVGDNVLVSYLVSLAISELTNNAIVDLLSGSSWNQESLIDLKNNLTKIKAERRTLAAALELETQKHQKAFSVNEKEQLLRDLELQADNADTRHAIEAIKHGDQAFFAASRQYYLTFSEDIQRALKGPTHEAYKQLEVLTQRPGRDAKVNDHAILTAMFAPALTRCSCLDIRVRTQFNALQAAIELTLIKLRTGQLPDPLPAGLPQDLFSNQDFAYEKTGNRFTLRCQTPDPCRDRVYDYHFTVKSTL